MRSKITLFPILLLLFSISISAGSLEEFARQAVSSDQAVAGPAIGALRAEGQSGLDALFRVYAAEIEHFKKTGRVSDSWEKISLTIDSVAMQKDAYAAGLFWETDLREALKQSARTGKPILSLRLLGNLNEEFSCANSRFFRAILYPDKRIGRALRENYILHWKSVRPAPRITIDFGDGRKIERTITGNSIHYVLDENGRILDALPGLYNPTDFLRFLDITAGLHQNVKQNPRLLENYREIRRRQLLNKWRADLEKIGAEMPEANQPLRITVNNQTETTTPTALEAAPRAVTKSIVELPVVKSLAPDETLLREDTDLTDWKELAELFGQPGISPTSRTFIRRQVNAGLTEDVFERLIQRLEAAVSLDTVRNEYLFHTEIYRRLATNPEADVESFNERIYAELFLTPRTDEWLGLYSADVYTALSDNGVIQ